MDLDDTTMHRQANMHMLDNEASVAFKAEMHLVLWFYWIHTIKIEQREQSRPLKAISFPYNGPFGLFAETSNTDIELAMASKFHASGVCFSIGKWTI